MAYTFTENFNAANQTISGYNGWTTGGSSMAISSNEAALTTTSTTQSDYHSISTVPTFPLSLSYKVKDVQGGAGTGARFVSAFCVGGSATAPTALNSSGLGIQIWAFRSDSITNNSRVYVYDGSTQVLDSVTSFQWVSGSQISISATINADGSGSGTASQGSNSHNFSWGARTWTNITTARVHILCEGTGNVAFQGQIDDLSLTFGINTNPGFLLNFI